MLPLLLATFLLASSTPETTSLDACAVVEQQALRTLEVALDIQPGRDLSEASDLTNDLGLDDEDMSDVSEAFNEVFGLDLPEDRDLRTVGDLVGIVLQSRGCSSGRAT